MKSFPVKTVWIFPLIITILGSGYVILFHSFEEEVKDNLTSKVRVVETEEKTEAKTVSAPLTKEVHLRRTYLDGEQSEEIVYDTIWSMEDFWISYSDWNLIDQDVRKVIFAQDIDDISPLSKVNGFFGLTEEGTLTIFNGKPKNQKVIQSFYQLDVQELKSSLYRKLEEGIPVQSKQNFKAILNQYEPYAIKRN